MEKYYFINQMNFIVENIKQNNYNTEKLLTNLYKFI